LYKPFNFNADSDRDPDTGILTELLTLRDRGSCENFCGISCLNVLRGLQSPDVSIFVFLQLYLCIVCEENFVNLSSSRSVWGA